jgi:signal recognition particle subunit SRP54
MTKIERAKPNILNASRRKRIAAGSGTTVQDVNKLIKQYEQMEQMMKRMKKMGMGGMMNAMKSMMSPEDQSKLAAADPNQFQMSSNMPSNMGGLLGNRFSGGSPFGGGPLSGLPPFRGGHGKKKK